MSTQFLALVEKLKEIFQIDRPDLDFGVYRILNSRSQEINEFLTKRLKEKVDLALKDASNTYDQNELKILEDKLRSEFGSRAFDDKGELVNEEARSSELGQHYLSIKKAPANRYNDESVIYQHLLTFFSRYYDEGDFISQRRYKGDTYAIPYAGEEVMLHWANKDQYYTKSGEQFSNYRIKLADGRTVLFRLVAADTARENRKDNDKNRCFSLIDQPRTITKQDEEGEEYEEILQPFEVINGELVVLFEYKAFPTSIKQAGLNSKALEVIEATDRISDDWKESLLILDPTEKDPKRTFIQKHLDIYTQKNSADYFIHKDLGKFLRHELDFYIKNEVMNLDDVTSSESFSNIERQLVIIKTLRQIGLEIISFLASLEDFQKKLWLKKKFVVRSDYSITLDRVDEKLYPLIVENDGQWQKWEELGFRDKTAKNWQTEAYLQEHQYMMLDTALFPNSFKYQLINSIQSLDEQTDGVIIHSDNFQALNLLQNRYQESIQAIYIDPPYNTNASEIIYKNGFKHSSWLSLLDYRLSLSKLFLLDEGIICLTIDDLELYNLKLLLDNNYGENNYLSTVLIRNNPSGRSTIKGFSVNHEYALFYSKSDLRSGVGRLSHDESQKSRYSFRDNKGFFEWENLRRNGPDSQKEDRPKQYYPIAYNEKTQEIFLLEMYWNESTKKWIYESTNLEGKIKIIFPIHPLGDHRVWRYSKEHIEIEPERFKVEIKNGQYEVYRKKYLNNEGILPRTWWDKPSYSARDNGTRFLVNLFGEAAIFDFPKAIGAVQDALKVCKLKDNALTLDFFAGSGTTAHATIELNREDDGQRKYILVEQGEYFNTVLKPRIQKVVYSQNWKDGKPLNPETGMSHCLKVMKLESYEDTLNNLELIRSKAQKKLFENDKLTPEQKDDYLMHYMLNFESQGSILSVKDFYNPFDYKMKITIDSAGAYEEVPVDLIETFNYLIGLEVRDIDYQIERGYVQVTGTTRDGEYTTIIWRDCEKLSYSDLNTLIEKLKINAADSEYDLIYVNGDHNIANRNVSADGTEKTLKIRSIENDFMQLMFEEQ